MGTSATVIFGEGVAAVAHAVHLSLLRAGHKGHNLPKVSGQAAYPAFAQATHRVLHFRKVVKRLLCIGHLQSARVAPLASGTRTVMGTEVLQLGFRLRCALADAAIIRAS